MITVHHLNNSRSQRVLWLLEELDLPYEIKHYYWLHFAEGTAMNPLLMKLVFNRILNAPMPFFAKPIARSIATKVC